MAFNETTEWQASVDRLRDLLAGDKFSWPLIRARGWIASLGKLGFADFQAVAATNRALLECLVDVALIAAPNFSAERLVAWEDWAFACALEQAAGAMGASTPESIKTYLGPTQVASLRSEGERWFPNRKGKGPPSRWTGHDLHHDVSVADGAFPQVGIRLAFKGFYKLDCLLTHATSASALKVLSTEEALSSLVLGLALGCCGLVDMLGAVVEKARYGQQKDEAQRHGPLD